MPDRSDHKDAQVILHKMQQGGAHYIESVSEGLKTAESGFAFANRAQDLCNNLGSPECSDELIRDSIAEMRAIVQKMFNDAKATAEFFSTNRQEFAEVRQGLTDEMCNNTMSVDPDQHFKDTQRYQD
jgi:hypothetical protein